MTNAYLQPLDMNDVIITDGVKIVIGTTRGLRYGKVVGVKSISYLVLGGGTRTKYSIRVELESPTEKTQSFDHDHMGKEKFLVIG